MRVLLGSIVLGLLLVCSGCGFAQRAWTYLTTNQNAQGNTPAQTIEGNALSALAGNPAAIASIVTAIGACVLAGFGLVAVKKQGAANDTRDTQVDILNEILEAQKTLAGALSQATPAKPAG